jgi:flagellar biogenesis protein FliO
MSATSQSLPGIVSPETIPAEVSRRQFPSGIPALRMLVNRLASALSWILKRLKVQQARKSLRLCENLSLGEKRFVAVVQVDGERFLIGGSSSSVSLLTRLPESKTFAEALQQSQKEETTS